MRLVVSRKTPRCVHLFFFLTLPVFLFVFPFNAGTNNPNENVRTYMTMAIVDFHTFRIDKVVERQGWVNDMAVAPDKLGEFHHYSVKGPATGYLGVPVYWAFTKLAPRFGHAMPTTTSPPDVRVWWMRATTLVLRLFVIQIPCFLFLIGFERFLRHFSDDPVLRLSAVAAAGLGTNYLAYSLMFVSHALFAVAAFTSFALITHERLLHPNAVHKRRVSRALLAGLFAGLASMLEYHAFPVSCGLALYALTTFYRPTRLLAFIVGAGIDAGALMFYQWRCYGNPLTPGHKFAENPVFANFHHQGFFGLTGPNFDVFKQLSLSHAFGFFGTSPFMWLGLLALPFGVIFASGTSAQRRIRRAASLAWLLMMAVLWVAISSAVNWRGGWTIGPRFFGCAPPFFAFGAVCALEQIARRGALRRAIVRGVAGGLALASVIVIGFVSLEVNSIPEEVTRPLPQLALPLWRAGFVPHHVGELVGLDTFVVFYVVTACMLLAACVAALVPNKERWWTYVTRVLLVAGLFVLGAKPAFSAPQPEEGGDAGASARRGFSMYWEPPGRDRITKLRARAESLPCLWYRVADLERTLEWTPEAARDEQRATTPREACR